MWAILIDADEGSQSVETGDEVDVGVYEFIVMAKDQAGNYVESEQIFFVVYDPEGGFVTGGGWIYSEPEAFKWDEQAQGKASFGFVSKYSKGATTPTGQAEFVFRTGNLNFHSRSYDWLVVTGSDYAKLKGWGSINGEGDYRFMLWAGDAPDTFRIRIWQEDDVGNEFDVYDNGFDQNVYGGSIIIHGG